MCPAMLYMIQQWGPHPQVLLSRRSCWHLLLCTCLMCWQQQAALPQHRCVTWNQRGR
jgi:hypothetical protein